MKSWLDLGINASGKQIWELSVSDDSDPTIPSSKYTGTKDEIADMLADSQQNANRRITELRRSHNGNGAASAHSQPRPLTPDERIQVVTDLGNPATVDRGITRVMESLPEVVARSEAEEKERVDRLQFQAARAFAENEPEWFSSPHNDNTLVNAMVAQGMDLTSASDYQRAFQSLRAAKLLQARPEAQDINEPEEIDDGLPNAPAPRPTTPAAPKRISTGITNRDISGVPPRPNTVRLKYSREFLDNIGQPEYKRLLQTDRAELERCVNYYATHPQVTRRAV